MAVIYDFPFKLHVIYTDGTTNQAALESRYKHWQQLASPDISEDMIIGMVIGEVYDNLWGHGALNKPYKVGKHGVGRDYPIKFEFWVKGKMICDMELKNQ